MTSCLDIYRLNTIEHNCPVGEDGWFQYSGERCLQEALLPIVSEEQLPGHQSDSEVPSWRVHIAGFHDFCLKIKHIWNKLSTLYLASVEHLFCSVDTWPGKGLPYWTFTPSTWPWEVLPQFHYLGASSLSMRSVFLHQKAGAVFNGTGSGCQSSGCQIPTHQSGPSFVKWGQCQFLSYRRATRIKWEDVWDSANPALGTC